MAGKAIRFASKEGFASRRASGDPLSRAAAHRAKEADKLPDLVVTQSHRWHGGSGDTVFDDAEDLSVFVTMLEDAFVERRAASAVASCAVTSGAHLIIKRLAGL